VAGVGNGGGRVWDLLKVESRFFDFFESKCPSGLECVDQVKITKTCTSRFILVSRNKSF
jgi:hypothetical protein